MPASKPDPARKIAQCLDAECLSGRVRFLNRSITSIYDDAFRPLGVTAGQISILAEVVGRGRVAPVDLVSELNMEKSTMSRNLERMRKAGWVSLRSEGRNQIVTPTRKGSTLLQHAHPLWKEAQKATRKLLGSGGAQDLRKVADHLRSKITGS